MTTPTLLLAPRINETGLQLLTAARRRGLAALTARRWAVPEELAAAGAGRTHLYGGPLFADSVAAELGVAPLDVPPGWLAELDRGLMRREVRLVTLAEARRSCRPAFVKPPVDKLFAARVYPDGSGLPGPDALDGDTPVLVSDIVRFRSEYRLFVLDGEPVAASRYAVDGGLAVEPADGEWDLAAFAREVLAASAGTLPSAVVIDLGLLDRAGDWAVVEANPAWASGGYACAPERVLDVVLRAAGPVGRLREADRAFVREVPEVVR